MVGLGYVGLPLAVEYAEAGYHVVGIDLSEEKVARIKAGDSYIGDVPSSAVKPLVASGKLRATADFSAVRDLDTINICVPTPLRKTKDPDMSYIVAACEEIATYFHPGILVILESTTYPGTTDELVLPMLEKSGLKCGEDFFLCFSPERVDPGNAKFQTKNIPKVGRWRDHSRRAPRSAGSSILRRSRRWLPSARPRWPRWSSCSKTRSA